MESWQIDGVPVFLVDSRETALLQCKAMFRQNMLSARFIIGSSVRDLLSELINPTEFKTKTSNYYIYSVTNNASTLEWDSEYGCIGWLDGHLYLDEQKLCSVCFPRAKVISVQLCKIHTTKRKTQYLSEKRKYVCEYEGCGKAFKESGNLKKHKRVHTDEKPYVCDFEDCGKAFAASGNLVTHKHFHTNERPYVCDFEDCGKAFTQSTDLTTHKRIHNGEKPYICDFKGCDKAFSQSGNLVKHKRRHTSERPYVCDFENCKKTFVDSGHLITHKRSHTGEKPYACNFKGCGKSFTQSGNLETHKRRHTSEKPYVCDFENCKKTFVESGHLITHKRSHTGEKPYVCNFADCGQTFSTSGSLVTHKRSHTGEKPHTCDFEDCGKAFTTSGQLVIHTRTHTGEKPYVCDFEDCGKAFACSGNLVTHKAIHIGERPYICDFENCEAAFSTSQGLITHKKVHTGDKPYICDHCPYRSAYNHSIKNHMQMHETQKSYEFECKMQDGGTQLWAGGDILCSIRTKTALDMDVHIERNHTTEGIGKKLHSETKLAEFFKSKNIAIERDWMNYIKFKYCKNIEGNSTSARPDFFLPEYSALLKAIVIIGNDEFAHRKYPCDFRRVYNIVQALQQTDEFKDVPILYIRFNPHGYHRDGMFYSHSLAIGHEILLCTLQNINVTELKRGLNLVYIHYDQTDGKLDIFKPNEENNYGELLNDCILLTV